MTTRDEKRAALVAGIDGVSVVHLRVPRGVNIAVRSCSSRWVTVHAKRRAAHTGDIRHGSHREWFAPSVAAVGRLGHVGRVKRREAGRTVPENVYGPIGSDDWVGALAVVRTTCNV